LGGDLRGKRRARHFPTRASTFRRLPHHQLTPRVVTSFRGQETFMERNSIVLRTVINVSQ
jgi:hypothetical protein